MRRELKTSHLRHQRHTTLEPMTDPKCGEAFLIILANRGVSNPVATKLACSSKPYPNFPSQSPPLITERWALVCAKRFYKFYLAPIPSANQHHPNPELSGFGKSQFSMTPQD